MGQALYRKYRSRNLAEIVGQEHITEVLSQAIVSGKLSHAYLFTGPRGVGKTSIARILAHEANKLPYDGTASHIDIIEIDAASNRRIDEIRELRDKVHIAPSSARYKVYIIDEVHMLTREAFNALLKTLEEPPAHVIFILATTELHKLPETIISRTQHFAFKPVVQDKVVEHLAGIAKKEKIAIEKSALDLIAQHGEGSFRDSISLLDQVANFGRKVTLVDVQAVIGIAPDEAIDQLINAVRSQQAAECVTTLQSLKHQGIEATALAKQLHAKLRTELLDGTNRVAPTASLSLQTNLLEIAMSSDPFLKLEIILLQAIYIGMSKENQSISATATPHKPASQESTSQVESEVPPKKITRTSKVTEASEPEPSKKPEPEKKVKAARADLKPFNETIWTATLNDVKKTYNTLYGILRMATPTVHETRLTLVFAFAFHQKRIHDPKNRTIVIDAVRRNGGNIDTLECIVADKTAAKISDNDPKANLSAISNIFGSTEVLES